MTTNTKTGIPKRCRSCPGMRQCYSHQFSTPKHISDFEAETRKRNIKWQKKNLKENKKSGLIFTIVGLILYSISIYNWTKADPSLYHGSWMYFTNTMIWTLYVAWGWFRYNIYKKGIKRLFIDSL